MTVQTYPLLESASVTLDANGDGSVKIGPTRISETWTVTSLAVATSTNNKIARAYVYLGTESPGGLLGGTENGARDHMGPDQLLHTNQFLTVSWKAGDPASVATVTLIGSRTAGAWS